MHLGCGVVRYGAMPALYKGVAGIMLLFVCLLLVFQWGVNYEGTTS